MNGDMCVLVCGMVVLLGHTANDGDDDDDDADNELMGN